jgi:hypothetical protein
LQRSTDFDLQKAKRQKTGFQKTVAAEAPGVMARRASAGFCRRAIAFTARTGIAIGSGGR